MVWYGMVWYGNTLFNDAGPDSNLLVSTGGVKTLTIYKKEKKEEIFTCIQYLHPSSSLDLISSSLGCT